MFKKIFFLFFAFLTTFCCANAENFYIKNYDIEMTVNRAKQVHITEKLDTFFKYKSHGIVREIPIKNGQVKNIAVSERYSVSKEHNMVYIKIGHPDKYILDNHNYEITYDFNLLDNKNEFYFNIIGTEWPTSTDYVHFRIEMPKKLNPDKVGLSIGKYGTKGFKDGAKYTVKDNIIDGEVTRVLERGECVTIRIEVPDGYFDKYKNTKAIVSYLIIIISTLACFVIWFMYGKDDLVIPVVNFYPPENMNPFEIEFISNENVTKKGVIAMIIYLAHKGYIEIKDQKNDFLIHRIKNYDGENEYEDKIMKSLFSSGKDNVSGAGLQKTYFGNKMESMIADKNGKLDEIFEELPPKSVSRKIMIICLWLIAFVMIYAYSNFDIMQSGYGIVATIVFTLGIWFLYEMVQFYSHKFLAATLLYTLVLLPAFGLALVFFDIFPYMYSVCFASTFCWVISFVCFYNLPKRKNKYTKLKGEIAGLKRFIKTAELEKLKHLTQENACYFYSVLPLAYVFGLSDKWIKKFEKLTELKVEWNDNSSFNRTQFDKFMKQMNTVTDYQASPVGTSSSGSSGSSGRSYSSSSGGGGHSGGGHGGGGGHSW